MADSKPLSYVYRVLRTLGVAVFLLGGYWMARGISAQVISVCVLGFIVIFFGMICMELEIGGN